MSSVLLEESHLSDLMRAAGVPGLAIAAQQGETMTVRTLGTARTDQPDRTITPRTLFRIGSTTKPLTATLVMKLVEDGLLTLDDPVTAFVPELDLADAERITVRQLLSHRAGFPPGGEELGHQGEDAITRFVAETLPDYARVAPPGMIFSYSNPGYSFLGFLTERVTGESYEHLMHELVFEPLGMTSASFRPWLDGNTDVALAHVPSDPGKLRVVERYFDDPAGWPAGFLFANLHDLTRFASFIINDGNTGARQHLQPETVQEMLTPQADLLTADEQSYGLGFFLDRANGTTIVHHGGSIQSYATSFLLAPEHETAVIVLTNRPQTDALTGLGRQLLIELLGLLSKPAAKTGDDSLLTGGKADLHPALGTYLGKRRGRAMLYIKDGQPTLDLNGVEMPLRSARRNVLTGRHPHTGETVSLGIVKDAAPATTFVIIDSEPCERIQEARVEEDSRTTERLRSFCGAYQGFDELTVSIDDGKLAVHSEMYGRKMTCVRLAPRRFACDYGIIEFKDHRRGHYNTVVVWDQFPLWRPGSEPSALSDHIEHRTQSET